jgi:hypothetical protein
MKRVSWIEFYDEENNRNYHPELIEVIAMVLLSPFFWVPVILISNF